MENNKQIPIGHYNFNDYVPKDRWASYWHQIQEVMNVPCKSLLIIGNGDGIVASCLKSQGIHVQILDIDEHLKPDFLGSVTDVGMIVQGLHFDCILCCQVLEHLPFDRFEAVLKQFSKISEHLIISLPNCGFKFSSILKFHDVKIISFSFSFPNFLKKWRFDGQHYWELGAKDYPTARIEQIIKKSFSISKSYLVQENPYHRFYCLKAVH